jgi:TonB family protein
MAPRAKITDEETGPTTLPADFGEWDSGGAPPTTLPDNFTDFDDTLPKPAAIPAPVKPPPPPRVAAKVPDITPSRAQSSAYADTDELAESPRSKRAKVAPAPKRRAEVQVEAEDEDEGQAKGKGKMIFGAIGAVLVLVLVAFLVLNSRKSAPKPIAQNQTTVQEPTTTATSDTPTTAKPKPTATQATTATTTTAQDTTNTEEQAPAPVQSATMQAQLNAAPRISENLKTSQKDTAPAAGFSAVDMGGGSGAMGAGVFNAKSGPKVTAAAPKPAAVKTLNVSSSVMAARAISRTPPVYPPFARSARVEGTVELHAVISAAGTITSLSVINGPNVLRQAALDAVKTWRYKPYLLDNEPVEVETTVNVVFVLR